ncbi:MAG: hypothetical protein AAGD13_03515 [Pseudomonadota bacterium]
MTRIEANPGDNLAELSASLKDGGTIFLNPGLYGPELFEGICGTAEAPVTIIGTKEAVFEGGKRYADVRTELNIMAYGSEAVREAKGRELRAAGDKKAKIDYIPSLGTVGQRGHIRIRNCRHLRLMGFSIRGAWPTCIAIDQSQSITLAGLAMEEGTFAIHVEGEDTYGITVHRCTWTQDKTETLMWDSTGWKAIHGDDFHPGDERGLDGDFFRSFGIMGKVTIRYCIVRHAFNAVHMYHSGDGSDPTQNRDVRIHDNKFEFIRDNAVEAERGAVNWWIYRNDMRNVHKWLALEVNHSSHVYCFANTCWFDKFPSTKAIGSSAYLHSGGGFFKTRKKSKQITAHGPHYFFNNSAYIRTGYIKKGVLKDFHHFNNAIHCVEDPSRSGEDKRRPFFWQPGQAPEPWPGGKEPDMNPDHEDTGSHFTRLWAANKVAFTSDVIAHSDIPKRARKLGYPLKKTVAAEPGFKAPEKGDLSLRKGAPARDMRGKLLPIRLALINSDQPFEKAAPAAAGSWQGKDRLRLGITVPGFEVDPVWQSEVEALDALLEAATS